MCATIVKISNYSTDRVGSSTDQSLRMQEKSEGSSIVLLICFPLPNRPSRTSLWPTQTSPGSNDTSNGHRWALCLSFLPGSECLYPSIWLPNIKLRCMQFPISCLCQFSPSWYHSRQCNYFQAITPDTPRSRTVRSCIDSCRCPRRCYSSCTSVTFSDIVRGSTSCRRFCFVHW